MYLYTQNLGNTIFIVTLLMWIFTLFLDPVYLTDQHRHRQNHHHYERQMKKSTAAPLAGPTLSLQSLQSDFIPRFSKICQRYSDNTLLRFLQLYIRISLTFSIYLPWCQNMDWDSFATKQNYTFVWVKCWQNKFFKSAQVGVKSDLMFSGEFSFSFAIILIAFILFSCPIIRYFYCSFSTPLLR